MSPGIAADEMPYVPMPDSTHGEHGREPATPHPPCFRCVPSVRILIANGTVGLPILEGIDYFDAMRESPSLLEQVLAIFANVLQIDAGGNPVNAKEAERRAAEWIRQYMSGEYPTREWEDWEVHLY